MANTSLSYVQAITELWCDVCDSVKVANNNHETGKFFSKEGHLVNLTTGKLEEAYTRIVWAVCSSCLGES